MESVPKIDVISRCKAISSMVSVSRESINQFSSGAIGGMAGLIIGHPMETIKVLMQNSSNQPTIFSVTLAIKNAGLSRFFTGLGIPFCSYGLINAVSFSTYKSSFNYFDPTGNSPIASATAGAVSGFVQLIPAVPIEVIKTQLQSNAIRTNTNMTTQECIRRIIRSSGIRGFYTGAIIQAFRDVPGFMTYFYVYTELMKLGNSFRWNTFWTSFFGGAIGGALSWCVSMPFDVIKTRSQSHHGISTRSIIAGLLKEKDYSFLYCGCRIILIRAFLVNACTFAAYETTYDFLTNTL